MLSPLLNQLVQDFQLLPGIGRKTALRLALHLLCRNRQGGLKIANSLSNAMSQIKHCAKCRTLTELDICELCSDSERNQQQICIIENPQDMYAIENTRSFHGLYFLLLGQISPLDGIGPEQLGLDLLFKRLSFEPIEEVIIATNSNMEGEATAYYIIDAIKTMNQSRATPIEVSRIAFGVPLGSELDMHSAHTLNIALNDRKLVTT